MSLLQPTTSFLTPVSSKVIQRIIAICNSPQNLAEDFQSGPRTREEFLELATHNCTEPKEFLREISIYNEKYYSDGEWIFRGHLDADWELIPSVFRDNQVLNVAELLLQKHREQSRNDASSKELDERGEAFKFILARVCAAVEHDRVNSFVIGLDNADIGIPYHSNFSPP